MFYKNVLYVVPIWVYGIFSEFSATSIYNDLLYQFYNLLYTGMPICWFSTFDWQYEKLDFLKKPNLYKVGLKNEYFSPSVFWLAYFNAFWQGSLLCVLTF